MEPPLRHSNAEKKPFKDKTVQWGGDVAHWRSIGPSCSWRRFDCPVWQGIFLPRSVRTPPCAIARINICAHVNDPVVHVRVRWIMKTLKHPACTVGWVVQLCRSRLSPKKQPVFPMGEKVKSKKKRRVKCKSKKKVERNSAEPLNKPPQTILYRRSE